MLTDDSVNSLKSSLSTFAARGVNLLPSAQPQQLNKQTGNVSSSQTFPSDEVTSSQTNQEIAGSQSWLQPRTNVYINIKNNPELVRATREAMKVWNSTGSFTFKETKDRRQANITVEQYDSNATNAAGVANTSFNPLTGHLLSARVRLNVYYLQNPYFAYGYQRILYTAEYELGHAIGLQHVNRESVMYSVGSYFGIEQGDVNSVNSLYDGENN